MPVSELIHCVNTALFVYKTSRQIYSQPSPTPQSGRRYLVRSNRYKAHKYREACITYARRTPAVNITSIRRCTHAPAVHGPDNSSCSSNCTDSLSKYHKIDEIRSVISEPIYLLSGS